MQRHHALVDTSPFPGAPYSQTFAKDDLYEEIIEALLGDLSAVFVRLKVLHGGVKLTLELGAKTQISMDRLGFIAVSDEVNVELDDEDIFVTLTLGGGVKC